MTLKKCSKVDILYKLPAVQTMFNLLEDLTTEKLMWKDKNSKNLRFKRRKNMISLIKSSASKIIIRLIRLLIDIKRKPLLKYWFLNETILFSNAKQMIWALILWFCKIFCIGKSGVLKKFKFLKIVQHFSDFQEFQRIF